MLFGAMLVALPTFFVFGIFMGSSMRHLKGQEYGRKRHLKRQSSSFKSFTISADWLGGLISPRASPMCSADAFPCLTTDQFGGPDASGAWHSGGKRPSRNAARASPALRASTPDLRHAADNSMAACPTPAIGPCAIVAPPAVEIDRTEAADPSINLPRPYLASLRVQSSGKDATVAEQEAADVRELEELLQTANKALVWVALVCIVFCGLSLCIGPLATYICSALALAGGVGAYKVKHPESCR